MSRVYVRVQGVKALERKMTSIEHAVAHPEPALNVVGKFVMHVIDETFQAQGRRGGGSWKKLTDPWKEYKSAHGLDPRIGHASLALRKSLTESPNPHVLPGRVTVRSDLPYAGTQQRHRPFFKTRGIQAARDRAQMRKIIADYYMEAFRSA